MIWGICKLSLLDKHMIAVVQDRLLVWVKLNKFKVIEDNISWDRCNLIKDKLGSYLF